MKIVFHLEYQTTFGEELMLNIMQGDQPGEPHKMLTTDGRLWTCEIVTMTKPGTYVDYYYSVVRGDEVMRREWLVVPHRLEFSARKGVRYTVYDHWLDIPENSFL